MRIFIGNLPYNLTDDKRLREELFDLGFEPSEIKLIFDRETGNCRGFAFLDFANAVDGHRAISELGGAIIAGRPVRVSEATERPRSGGGGGGGGSRGGGGGGGYRSTSTYGEGGGGGGGGGDRGRGKKGRGRQNNFGW